MMEMAWKLPEAKSSNIYLSLDMEQDIKTYHFDQMLHDNDNTP